jgi:hypothetical protein
MKKREPAYTDAPSGNWEQPVCRTPGRFLSNENENEIRLLPNTLHKINSKQIKDLNKRTDNMKLLREKAEQALT